MGSALERLLALQIEALRLPLPERQYQFCPGRRWKFDFAWPAFKLAVEVEGGTWINGGHVRGKGFEEDCSKYNEAALLGWRVLRVTTDMVSISDARAIKWIERALDQRDILERMHVYWVNLGGECSGCALHPDGVEVRGEPVTEAGRMEEEIPSTK